MIPFYLYLKHELFVNFLFFFLLFDRRLVLEVANEKVGVSDDNCFESVDELADVLIRLTRAYPTQTSTKP